MTDVAFEKLLMLLIMGSVALTCLSFFVFMLFTVVTAIQDRKKKNDH